MSDQCYGQKEMFQGRSEAYENIKMYDAELMHQWNGESHVEVDLGVYVKLVAETIPPCPTQSPLAADSCFYTVLPVPYLSQMNKKHFLDPAYSHNR